jgi:hypothetical protein
MRKLLVAGVLVGATLFAPGLVPEARAYHDWLAVGAAFRVGAAHISFVFGRPSLAYQPAYYFRYDRPIRYRGHSCSRQCFHDGGRYYHHESCPLVGAHFRNYGVDPYWAFDRYAPRFAGYDGYGGRYDDRYGRYDDRYDRHDRYGRDRYDDRYDDRYRRRGRYDDDRHGGKHRGKRGRGHRHHRGCDHDD